MINWTQYVSPVVLTNGVNIMFTLFALFFAVSLIFLFGAVITRLMQPEGFGSYIWKIQLVVGSVFMLLGLAMMILSLDFFDANIISIIALGIAFVSLGTSYRDRLELKQKLAQNQLSILQEIRRRP